MNLFVLLKMVPDTVEELTVAEDQKQLEKEFLRLKLSDADEHALEQALLLKEKSGGAVTVATLDAPEVDDVLFTALAKGADRAVKIGAPQDSTGVATAARSFAELIKGGAASVAPDTLVLVGTQAYDDLEGELVPWLAHALQLPSLSVICAVSLAGGRATVLKEFSGGLRGEFEVALPAVLGIQSAEKPPRYVPIAKVRAIRKSAKIDSFAASAPSEAPAVAADRMYKPEAAGRAKMLEGSSEELAERIVSLLTEHGVV